MCTASNKRLANVARMPLFKTISAYFNEIQQRIRMLPKRPTGRQLFNAICTWGFQVVSDNINDAGFPDGRWCHGDVDTDADNDNQVGKCYT